MLWNQTHVLLRRGSLPNLAARGSFWPLWALACYGAADYGGASPLLVLAQANLWFALALHWRCRLIQDTPTSHLSSSAQGYVELQGRARLPEGEGWRGLPELPVTLWLPGYIEDQPFLLDDGKGLCWLYPDTAEIVTNPADNHLDWLHAIYPGQTLYVLGEMRTLGGDNRNFNHRLRTSELLSSWKRNPRALLEAYDTDGNGQLDPDEWERVCDTARQLANADMQEERQQAATHVIEHSLGGRWFLITNILPHVLAGRYQRAALLHTLSWLGLMALVLGT